MFLSCVCCMLSRYRPLRRADHSFRGVLPGVCVCVCVCVSKCATFNNFFYCTIGSNYFSLLRTVCNFVQL